MPSLSHEQRMLKTSLSTCGHTASSSDLVCGMQSTLVNPNLVMIRTARGVFTFSPSIMVLFLMFGSSHLANRPFGIWPIPNRAFGGGGGGDDVLLVWEN
jgi:hypothetical protein